MTTTATHQYPKITKYLITQVGVSMAKVRKISRNKSLRFLPKPHIGSKEPFDHLIEGFDSVKIVCLCRIVAIFALEFHNKC